MTLYPDRYRISVVEKNGDAHTTHCAHPLLISVEEFLLRKNLKSKEAETIYFDTLLDRLMRAEEVHMEDELEIAA